jgi:hypothetical protein
MSEFEDWIEFRQNENPKPTKTKCVDCKNPAEGKYFLVEDPLKESLPICNSCHKNYL